MSVKPLIRGFASILVVGVTGAAVAAGSSAVGRNDDSSYALSPPRITPSGPIVVYENLVAGETRDSRFSLENANKARVGLYLTGTLKGTPSDLQDVLTAKITNTGTDQVAWQGGLRQLLSGAALGKLAGVSETDYKIAIGVPSWAGDAYGGKRTEFDMHFTLTADKGDYDPLAPLTSINLKRSMTRRKFVKVLRRGKGRRIVRFAYYGTAKDKTTAVSRVELSLVRRQTRVRRGKRISYCSSYVPLRKRLIVTSRNSCKPVWITAKGTTRWNYRFRRMKLAKGAYEVRVRSWDPLGNVETKFRRIGDKVNYIRYRVK